MYDITNKSVLITGASRGLGAALARALAGEGAKLCLTARDGTAVRDLAVALRRDFGAEVFGRECDVRDFLRTESVLDEMKRRFGSLDLIISNAGVLGPRIPIHQYPIDRWHTTIETNLTGPYHLIVAGVPRMTMPGARFMFVGSSVGHNPRPEWGAYAVSKYAAEGLMKLLASEADRTGVVAFSVNPGGTHTQMRREALPDEDPETLPSPEAVAGAIIRILRRADKDLSGRSFHAPDFL